MIWTQMIPDHLDLRQLTAFISSYCFLLYKSIQRSLKIDLLKLHMVQSFEDDIKLSVISFYLNKKLLIPELCNRIYILLIFIQAGWRIKIVQPTFSAWRSNV